MHRAVDKADINLVWPEVEDNYKKGKLCDDKIKWVDDEIKKNPEQAAAVRFIANRRFGEKAAPILLFGAFGTGKTR